MFSDQLCYIILTVRGAARRAQLTSPKAAGLLGSKEAQRRAGTPFGAGHIHGSLDRAKGDSQEFNERRCERLQAVILIKYPLCSPSAADLRRTHPHLSIPRRPLRLPPFRIGASAPLLSLNMCSPFARCASCHNDSQGWRIYVVSAHALRECSVGSLLRAGPHRDQPLATLCLLLSMPDRGDAAYNLGRTVGRPSPPFGACTMMCSVGSLLRAGPRQD